MLPNELEPTYANQLKAARRLADEKGVEELKRHAQVGNMCGCRDCFCCAAREVYRELTQAGKP